MTAEGKIKTSYDFTPRAKNRLRRLKFDLQMRGLTGISETAILEALIDSARMTEIESQFRKRKR